MYTSRHEIPRERTYKSGATARGLAKYSSRPWEGDEMLLTTGAGPGFFEMLSRPRLRESWQADFFDQRKL